MRARLGLPYFDPVWMRRVVVCALLLSTTASTYFLMHDQVTSKVMRGFDLGKKDLAAYAHVRPEWRARVGATMLVHAFYTADREAMADRIAWMFALGLLATGLLYVCIDARGAPFMMLATFCALYYCCTPRAENTWYPWDIPALFFGAASLLLALRRQTLGLAATILVAVTFKETLLVMAAMFLFYENLAPRRRVAWAAGTIGVGLLVRWLLQSVLGAPVAQVAFLYDHGKIGRRLRVVDNLKTIFSTELNHVLWCNVGLWLLVFFIPTRDPILRGFKLSALLCYAGLLLAGSYNEFRVFLELLPGTLLLAWQLLDGSARSAEPVPG